MTARAANAFLRALKRWTPSPASLWRILFPDTPSAGSNGRMI
jgi:hypothetical protein